jgi:hypothetical protein
MIHMHLHSEVAAAQQALWIPCWPSRLLLLLLC